MIIEIDYRFHAVLDTFLEVLLKAINRVRRGLGNHVDCEIISNRNSKY